MDIMLTTEIPVIINNRNRLTTTKNMVEKLLELNPNENIIIIDNDSTYEPLLEWYTTIENKITIRREKNEGHLAFWSIGLHKEVGEWYVYTDSDIVLNPNFPSNWKEIMFNLGIKHNTIKIALAISIDDLPDYYRYKNQVIRNEGRWWLNQVEEKIYTADTDTTFFMMKNTGDNQYSSIRIAWDNMICKHYPFYIDLNNLDKEEKYYLDHLGERVSTQYSKQNKNPELYNDI